MTDLTGKTIGDYTTTELIDDKSNTLVIKGLQSKMNRTVAIKVLKPHVSKDKAGLQAYEQYTNLAAKIQHPNILSVIDTGTENDSFYIVTPYMENRSVGDNMSRYTDPRQVSQLITGLTPGLEAIYKQGYVHGNLRPSNILLDPEFRPLLTDFGFTFDQDKTPTPFNSPEQVKGSAVDQRTDVYALGVILYTLLVGHAPSPGAALNVQSVRPDLPQSVEQVILKATAQSPDQRFQSPREFAQALAAALTAQPAAAAQQPQAQPKKGTNWGAIFTGVLGGVAIFLCLLVVLPRVVDSLNDSASAPPPASDPGPGADQPDPDPPEAEPPPSDPPADPGDSGGESAVSGSGLTSICSSLGLAGGIVLMGRGAYSQRRRKRKIL
jgi:serine/threonine-protein kinase